MLKAANCAKLPAFAYVLRAVLTSSPNSCLPERHFSIFNSMQLSMRVLHSIIFVTVAFCSKWNRVSRSRSAVNRIALMAPHTLRVVGDEVHLLAQHRLEMEFGRFLSHALRLDKYLSRARQHLLAIPLMLVQCLLRIESLPISSICSIYFIYSIYRVYCIPDVHPTPSQS